MSSTSRFMIIVLVAVLLGWWIGYSLSIGFSNHRIQQQKRISYLQMANESSKK